MKIYGMQKLTLTDYPGKMASILFTGGCNFSCPFCHNSELIKDIKEDVISEDEIFDYLKKRKNMLDGVVITGGEPTINNDLIPFIKEIKNLGYLVKLDTNGYLPDVLEDIIREGIVDYIAMDIKNSLERYPETVGLMKIDETRIKKSISLIISSSIDYEFRTTLSLELHDKDSIKGIGELIKGAKKLFLQKFVDSENVPNHHFTAPEDETLTSFVEVLSTYVSNVSVR